jgi:hypothetical protein
VIDVGKSPDKKGVDVYVRRSTEDLLRQTLKKSIEMSKSGKSLSKDSFDQS